jgi:hypothetical protein
MAMRDTRSAATVRLAARAAWLCLLAIGVGGKPGRADDAAVTPFVPGDISIGEPIVLPADQPSAAAPMIAAPASPTAAVPGNGWLGISVTESATPGCATATTWPSRSRRSRPASR